MLRFIFVLWCAAAFSVSIFGQSIETDLKRSFNKSSVVKINNREALRKAKSGAPFHIQINGKTFQFILKPNDIRSADYTAEYTDNDGRHSLPKGEVFTYQGTIVGEPNSLVALTVDGTKTEGYLATKSEGFFIESAKNYSSRAGSDDKVVYRVEDKVDKDDNICGLDEAVAEGMKSASSDADFRIASSSQTGRRVLEVATEADKEFVLEPIAGNGDPAKANARILSVMNQVDAVYRRDVNLRIVVTFQHAWMPGTIDPYASLTNTSLMEAFKNYWNANFPASNPNYRRNVAHLFTMKNTPGIGGMANASGGICYPEISYSFTSSFVFYEWLLVAHEMGHILGAGHACPGTIMQETALSSNITGFCQFSIDKMTLNLNIYGSCLRLDSTASPFLFDYDGDGKSDISVFRPDNGVWYLLNSNMGFSAAQFGISTDKIVPADYDGDGKTDLAVYRDGTWYLMRSSLGFASVQFGSSGDVPVPADFDNDSKAELAVFRPSNGTWYVLNPVNNNFNAVQFGAAEDKPVVADYDGDGRADYAVYRPSNGVWYLLQSTKGFSAVQFGNSTDKPVVGDYDDDGKADEAVYRPSEGNWYILKSTQGFSIMQFGISTDIPAAADYDGDGKTDIAVFRPENGVWYQMKSTQGFGAVQFGKNDDKPIPAAFVP